MPQAAETESESTGQPSDETSPQPFETAPEPGTRGALFRALVDAGADATVAYNAEEGTQSMVSDAIAIQVQPVLVEMRRLFAEQGERISALERSGAERGQQIASLGQQIASLGQQIASLTAVVTAHEQKLNVLTELVTRHDQKLNVLTELVTAHDQKLNVLTELVTRHDEKLDGLKRELRLIWGGLGVLITLLTVVFGFVFRG